METLEIQVDARDKKSKRDAKRLLRSGRFPAFFTARKRKPVSLEFDQARVLQPVAGLEGSHLVRLKSSTRVVRGQSRAGQRNAISPDQRRCHSCGFVRSRSDREDHRACAASFCRQGRRCRARWYSPADRPRNRSRMFAAGHSGVFRRRRKRDWISAIRCISKNWRCPKASRRSTSRISPWCRWCRRPLKRRPLQRPRPWKAPKLPPRHRKRPKEGES